MFSGLLVELKPGRLPVSPVSVRQCRKAGQVLALKSSPAFASTRIVYCGVSVEACSSSFRPVSSPWVSTVSPGRL